MPGSRIKQAVRRVRRKKNLRRQVRRKPVAMITKTYPTPKGPFRTFNSIDPFPTTYNTKFVYVGDLTMTTSTTQRVTGAIQEYRLNSPYDPNYTSAAVDPTNTACYGYYQLLGASGPYTRYKVNGVKVEILWYDPSDDGIAMVSHIRGDTDNFPIGTVDVQNLERAPMTVVNRINDSGSQKKRIVQYIPLNQALGWTKEQFRVEMGNSTGPYNGNPGLTPRLQLCVANNTSAVAKTINARVKITYYTVLYGRYSQTAKENAI